MKRRSETIGENNVPDIPNEAHYNVNTNYTLTDRKRHGQRGIEGILMHGRAARALIGHRHGHGRTRMTVVLGHLLGEHRASAGTRPLVELHALGQNVSPLGVGVVVG